MGNCPTVSHTFSAYLPSGWILNQGSEDVGLVRDFILLFCVWCESRELGGRGSSRFSYVTPVVETSWDRVAFRIPSNISNGALLRKQQTALTIWLLPQESPTQTSGKTLNTDLTGGLVNVACGWTACAWKS